MFKKRKIIISLLILLIILTCFIINRTKELVKVDLHGYGVTSIRTTPYFDLSKNYIISVKYKEEGDYWYKNKCETIMRRDHRGQFEIQANEIEYEVANGKLIININQNVATQKKLIVDLQTGECEEMNIPLDDK